MEEAGRFRSSILPENAASGSRSWERLGGVTNAGLHPKPQPGPLQAPIHTRFDDELVTIMRAVMKLVGSVSPRLRTTEMHPA